MNKEILNKVDEIVDVIKNSLAYQKYIDLQNQINNNTNLKMLINEVRVLQKDVTHHREKEEKLQEKINELNNQPLYREYINTVDEINNVLIIIENSLNNYFYKIFN